MPGPRMIPAGVALPGQPDTLGALRAMQSLILAECLVGGSSPFAALSSADATRYGVSRAVFVGKPKDFKDGYLPQCAIWIPPDTAAGTGSVAQDEALALEGYIGRASAEFEALVQVFVDMRTDWYAGEQQILQIRDALLPVLLHHERLGGTIPTVIASEGRAARGLCYESVAGVDYRCFEARWWVRQEWMISGGRVV